jgi:Ca2+-binding RTX toxin-like protein
MTATQFVLSFTPMEKWDGVIWVYGTSNSDRVEVNPNRVSISQPGAGKRFLKIGSGATRVVFFAGDENDTFVNNTAIPSEAYGGLGEDRLTGGSGDDEFYGGGNKDVPKGRLGRDKLYGNDGDDRIYGGREKDELWGGPGKDRLRGGRGKDVIHQDDGNDFAIGMAFATGADSEVEETSGGALTMYGSGQGDVLRITEQTNAEGQLELWATWNGEAELVGLANDWSSIEFHGGDGNDTFINDTRLPCVAYGDAGDDALRGGSADDQLYGGDGEDRVGGNAGNVACMEALTGTSWTAKLAMITCMAVMATTRCTATPVTMSWKAKKVSTLCLAAPVTTASPVVRATTICTATI